MNTVWTSRKARYTYLGDEDIPNLCRILAKETVCEGLFFGPNTNEETINYHGPIVMSIQEALLKGERPPTPAFSIKNSEGAFIGECAMEPIPYHHGSYVIGYQLDDLYWGKGHGTEACEFIIHYAFNVIGARRLNGDCQSNNPASRRVMEKNSFVLEGGQREYHRKGDRTFDRILYGLLRTDLSDDQLSALSSKFH